MSSDNIMLDKKRTIAFTMKVMQTERNNKSSYCIDDTELIKELEELRNTFPFSEISKKRGMIVCADDY